MRPDMDAMADAVLLTIKAALAPVLERLAASEARLQELAGLRDRVVVVETKAAVPVVPDPAIGECRDRVLALEMKAALPVPVPPVPEASVQEADADLRDRLVTLETRAAGPSVADMGLVDVRTQLGTLQAKVFDDALTKALAAVSERVAVIETRAPVPGPAGQDGLNGKDGAPGQDGASGKDGMAGLSFEGVYQDGKTYELGQLATWGGSSWHCNATTTAKPGDGSKDWTLMVKRGRDGRDGVDATGAVPVVSVGRR